MNARRLGFAAGALALAAIVAMPTMAADITVGGFLQEVAKVKNLNAIDARVAADSLAAAGVQLPESLKLSDRLTEGAVVQIARASGLNLSTSRPDSAFTDAQVEQFMAAFDGELRDSDFVAIRRDCTDPSQGCNGNDIGFDPFSKGKGKHKGHGKGHRSPTDPD